jgi:RNA polymerase sigma factor (sigma-70 family)
MDKIKYIYHPDFDDPTASEEIKAYVLNSDHQAYIKTSDKAYNSAVLPNEFIQDVRHHGVLKKHAEVMLFKQLNYFKHRYNITGNIEELKRALATKNIIADHNYRLIMKMVGKILYSRHKDVDELLSDCNYWLLGSIDSFDVAYNIKFSTYLCTAIWQNTSRRGKKRIITKSMHLTIDGENLDHDPSNIMFNQEPSHDLSVKESTSILYNVLRTALNKREFDIIVARYGIDGQPPMTLKEVGDRMNMNRERVRQLQAIAERKLSNHSELLNNLEFV